LDALAGATRTYDVDSGLQVDELFFIRDHLGSIVLVLKLGAWTSPLVEAVETISYTPYGVPTIHSRGSSGEAILRVHNESISHSRLDWDDWTPFLAENVREGEAYGNWVWAAESPRGATDQDGRVPKSAAQSSVGLKYLYASRPWSPVAEAYHNRARWYSPEAGRFLTRDPIGYLGGATQYMYANANPIMFTDPLGLWSWNPTTWGDPPPAEWGPKMPMCAREQYEFNSAGQNGEMWDAFLEGAEDGYIGWSNGFINTMSFGFAGNYADPNNWDQQFGAIMGMTSGIATQSAAATWALGAGQGVNFRILTNKSMVPVTSWAPGGVQSTIEGGRWVMLGNRTLGNWLLSGRAGAYPYSNATTQLVRWKDLNRAPWATEWKWWLGQARMRPIDSAPPPTIVWVVPPSSAP
jgi:RHS repeat-associated protein